MRPGDASFRSGEVRRRPALRLRSLVRSRRSGERRLRSSTAPSLWLLLCSGDARCRGDLSLTLQWLRCGDGLRPARRRSGERRRALESSRWPLSSRRPTLSGERRLAGRADASLCRSRDSDRRRLWALLQCSGSVISKKALTVHSHASLPFQCASTLGDTVAVPGRGHSTRPPLVAPAG